jgi:hypothetical protein
MGRATKEAERVGSKKSSPAGCLVLMVGAGYLFFVNTEEEVPLNRGTVNRVRGSRHWQPESDGEKGTGGWLVAYIDDLPLVGTQTGWGAVGLHGAMGFEKFTVAVNKLPYSHAVGMHPAAFGTAYAEFSNEQQGAVAARPGAGEEETKQTKQVGSKTVLRSDYAINDSADPHRRKLVFSVAAQAVGGQTWEDLWVGAPIEDNYVVSHMPDVDVTGCVTRAHALGWVGAALRCCDVGCTHSSCRQSNCFEVYILFGRTACVCLMVRSPTPLGVAACRNGFADTV